ncbi:MAG TPA: hypothetical protein VHM64_23500, partial [Candidatus Binatia bacterium]|nr:hypothetical protein [Candidatus Binatia bacterium]
GDMLVTGASDSGDETVNVFNTVGGADVLPENSARYRVDPSRGDGPCAGRTFRTSGLLRFCVSMMLASRRGRYAGGTGFRRPHFIDGKQSLAA